MRRVFAEQGIPLALTVLVFLGMWAMLHGEILLLNAGKGHEPIVLHLLPMDILVGLSIYVKTSIDFAIFIGHLMRTHPGWTYRVAIECGTAFGNALGTLLILALWNVLRDFHWLLAIMVLLSSLVLFKLAEDGLEHATQEEGKSARWLQMFTDQFERMLQAINLFFDPLLGRIVPHATLNVRKRYSWTGLLLFSASIPFILGLDDFAGYVPLFSVVHVYGFALGVLLGHMLLNVFLFISPHRTIAIVKQPMISLFGSIAFVGIALWGLFEVAKILMQA